MNKKIKILHLEDLESDADLIERLLQKSHLEFDKLVVNNRADYECALDEFKPDIILSDHSLPSFNSIEAFNILKQKKLHIPFILVTATVSEEFAVEVMKRGVTDYILKDRLQRLPAAITNAFDIKIAGEMQSLVEELENEKKLNRMKSNFVSFASHEFRTPLTTISSSAQLLSSYPDSTSVEIKERHINRILTSVNTLLGIIDEFLSVGVIEEGIKIQYSEWDVVEATEATVSELAVMCKKGQVIEYEHIGATTVVLDKIKYKAILVNLLSNAIKFSMENKPIRIQTYVTMDALILSVQDEGVGIPKGEIKQLSNLYFRGSNTTNIQGSGLGLYIIDKYIKLMNGTMRCISEEDKKTEFIIELKHGTLPYEQSYL